MFTLMQQHAKLETNGLETCLRSTCQEIENKLASQPILFLTYRQVPVLYYTEIMNAVERSICDNFTIVARNLMDQKGISDMLFIIQADEKEPEPTISSVAKIFVESKGHARFIVYISEYELEKIRKSPVYSLIKPYCAVYTEIAEDPAQLLTWTTGMEMSRQYKERRLAELLFLAAIAKIEGKWPSEEDISAITSNICVLQFYGDRKCYFASSKLPRFRELLRLYFESIGLDAKYHSIAQYDPDFYRSASLACLLKAARRDVIANAISGQPQNVSKNELSIGLEIVGRLNERQESFPSLLKVISFLYRLGIHYTLTQETEPLQSMCTKPDEFLEDQSLRRELVWVTGDLFHLEDVQDIAEWNQDVLKRVGSVVRQHLFTLAASEKLDLAETANHIQDIIEEFMVRIEDYSGEVCKKLFIKAVNTAYLLELSAILAKHKLYPRLTDKFIQLWEKCLDKLLPECWFHSNELETLNARVKMLSAVRPRYKKTLETMRIKGTSTSIVDAARNNEKASDRLNDFFNLFARFLTEEDFFLNQKTNEELGPVIGQIYLQLDSLLLEGKQPFDEAFLQGKDSSQLLASLATADYDRVYVLILDAFSYLDWKLSKGEYADLDCSIKEDYCLAPIPSYTPCALTALITGYHPSETGIFDWRLKTSSATLLDLQNLQEHNGIPESSLGLQKKNTLTLIHSMVGTPLTKLQTEMANLTLLQLPSTEEQKSITQAKNLIQAQTFETKLVVIYIADFDEIGHKWLKTNNYIQYYQGQSQRIKNDLIIPIFQQARKRGEKTLVVLTADHGKLMRYETKILSHVLREGDMFQQCAHLLNGYESIKRSRHIIAWIPESQIGDLTYQFQIKLTENSDAAVFTGEKLRRFFPYNSRTCFVNPNFVVLSRFQTVRTMSHGGGSLSELVIPAIRFSTDGG